MADVMGGLAGLGAGLGSVGQSLGDLAEFGMRQRQAAQQSALGEQQMQMNRQKIQANEFALKEETEKQKMLDRSIDMTAHPMFLSLPENHRQNVLKFFQENGLVDAQGHGRVRDIMSGVQMIESNSGLFKGMMQPVIEAKKQAYVKAYQELQDESAKPGAKPEKIKELQATVQKMQMDYMAATDQFDKHIEKLSLAEQKSKEKQFEQIQKEESQKRIIDYKEEARAKRPVKAGKPDVHDKQRSEAVESLKSAGYVDPSEDDVAKEVKRLKSGKGNRPKMPHPQAIQSKGTWYLKYQNSPSGYAILDPADNMWKYQAPDGTWRRAKVGQAKPAEKGMLDKLKGAVGLGGGSNEDDSAGLTLQ